MTHPTKLDHAIQAASAVFDIPSDIIMSRQRHYETVLARWAVIDILAKHGMRNTQIAKALGVSHGSVTHAQQRLDDGPGDDRLRLAHIQAAELIRNGQPANEERGEL